MSARASRSAPVAVAGYASVFGVADLAGDVVEPGAFSASLHRIPAAAIRMLHQHDPLRPIGRWTVAVEDAVGLWVEGLIDPAGPDAARALALVRAGALDGLSIGFRALAATPRPRGGRVLHEIDLREISLVAFPMAPRARLRVAAGLSPSLAA
jgi:HK97 family phage prohead protease